MFQKSRYKDFSSKCFFLTSTKSAHSIKICCDYSITCNPKYVTAKIRALLLRKSHTPTREAISIQEDIAIQELMPIQKVIPINVTPLRDNLIQTLPSRKQYRYVTAKSTHSTPGSNTVLLNS